MATSIDLTKQSQECPEWKIRSREVHCDTNKDRKMSKLGLNAQETKPRNR